MEQFSEQIIFYDGLSEAEKTKFHHAMENDPALASLFQQWQSFEKQVSESTDALIPDRRALVLYALESDGLLSSSEQAILDAARPALKSWQGLDEVVQQIRVDANMFNDVWDGHFDDQVVKNVTKKLATDRPAMRLVTSPLKWATRIAAVFLVAFTAYFALDLVDSEELTTITATGEMQEVVLEDGTVVKLAAGGSLTWLADAFDRDVTLSGDAFFDVSHNPDHQFVVHTSTAQTTVLGTAFGIRSDAKQTEVVLARGKVAFASNDDLAQEVILSPGQTSHVSAGNRPTNPAETSLSAELAWTGSLFFRNTDMLTLSTQLNDHFGIQIEVSDELANELVTGTFDKSQPPAEIVQSIAATLGITAIENENNVWILK